MPGSSAVQISHFLEGLTDFQAEFLAGYPCPQMFAIISWGCAATSWIATVLNRHPDICCAHAANQSWHVLGEVERLDGVRYMRVLARQAYTEVAAGDVHGVGREHVPELRRIFAERFNAVVAVREPLARIHSQLGLFRQHGEREEHDLAYIDPLISTTGVTLPSDAYRYRFFVHAANMLNAIVEEIGVGKIYRAEDLTSSPETLEDFVDEITRGRVIPAADWLRAAVGTSRVNAHARRECRMEFEDWQIDVIRKVVAPRAWELYQDFGYATPEFIL